MKNFLKMINVFGEKGVVSKNKVDIENIPNEMTFQIKKVGYKELN